MSNIKPGTLDDILALFEDSISCSDILSAKCLSKLSSAIAKKRIQLNLSQKEFAKKLNVSQGMVSRWEGTDYNFTIKTLADIASKLDMDLNVSLVDYVSTNEEYTMNNNYNCISSKPTQFKSTSNNIISFNQRKQAIFISKFEPLEM